MKITEKYVLSGIKQLVDLNGDMTNFDLTFTVTSKDNRDFQAVVVDQNTLDTNPNPDYKIAPGIISGNIVADQGIYQNYFLVLKCEQNENVEVTVDIEKNEIPRNPLYDATEKFDDKNIDGKNMKAFGVEAPLQQPPVANEMQQIKKSIFSLRNILIVLAILVICALLYYYFFKYKKNDLSGSNVSSSPNRLVRISNDSPSDIIDSLSDSVEDQREEERSFVPKMNLCDEKAKFCVVPTQSLVNNEAINVVDDFSTTVDKSVDKSVEKMVIKDDVVSDTSVEPSHENTESRVSSIAENVKDLRVRHNTNLLDRLKKLDLNI